MKKVILLVLLSGIVLGYATAQVAKKDFPVVGQFIPDFTLARVHYYRNTEFNPYAVKDKWIVLDFWNKGCPGCIRSFPKVNALQQQFEDEVQFLMIGQKDSEYHNDVQNIFEHYKKAFDLTLASAYDSVLFDRFKVQGLPHVIIIDPKKRVYAITYGSEITPEKIAALLAGKEPDFKRKRYDFEDTDAALPVWKFEMDTSATSNLAFLHRSILSEYRGEAIRGTSGSIDLTVSEGFFQVVGATLRQLYNLAYVGAASWGRTEIYFTQWKVPILELTDSSRFYHDYSNYQGLYNYSVVVPKEKSTRKYLMQVMQQDLKNYFGYEIFCETRLMPCWKFTATQEAKERLKTTKKRISFDGGPLGIKGERILARNILETVERFGANGILPLIDETNISYPIDIKFQAIMTNMADVKNALKEHGLILNEGEKEMKVLVIRDPRLEDIKSK